MLWLWVTWFNMPMATAGDSRRSTDNIRMKAMASPSITRSVSISVGGCLGYDDCSPFRLCMVAALALNWFIIHASYWSSLTLMMRCARPLDYRGLVLWRTADQVPCLYVCMVVDCWERLHAGFCSTRTRFHAHHFVWFNITMGLRLDGS